MDFWGKLGGPEGPPPQARQDSVFVLYFGGCTLLHARAECTEFASDPSLDFYPCPRVVPAFRPASRPLSHFTLEPTAVAVH